MRVRPPCPCCGGVFREMWDGGNVWCLECGLELTPHQLGLLRERDEENKEVSGA